MTADARLREIVSVRGPRVITAAHPASAAAGLAAFAWGGNAFDAALAACFMDTVALPMKAGLFGDVVALIRVGHGEFQSVVSIGAGPEALARGGQLEMRGPRSVGVPGAPHGYATLQRLARFELDRLIEPAVRASQTGLPWTRVALSYVQEARELLAEHSPANPYTPDDRIPSVGELRRLPGLGSWLELFARRREALFEGEEGAELIRDLARRGGFLTENDLRQRPASIKTALLAEMPDGARLTVTPPPTQGERLPDVVRASLSSTSLLEVVRADRVAAKSRGRLAMDGGTSVVTAADQEGNVAVVLHSNSFPQFGSGIVLDDGLILNNRPGRGFDLDAPASAPSAPKAGRVPPTTLHAWSLAAHGQLYVGATPGGVNQLPWNAQTVREVLRGASPAEVVTSPRWALDARDKLVAEDGAPLAGGIPSETLPVLSLRSAQQVIRLAGQDGLHEAAADPRTGCLALAAY